MAEKAQRNLASVAVREHYDTLHSAISQPTLVIEVASKAYKWVLITRETRDAIQFTTGISPGQRAALLLQAVESAIQIDYRNLRQFVRLLRKEPTLKPIAKALQTSYSKLVYLM